MILLVIASHTNYILSIKKSVVQFIINKLYAVLTKLYDTTSAV